MLLVCFLSLIQAEIFDLTKHTKEPFEMQFNVIEHQICKGYFEPQNAHYAYEVVIKSENGGTLFSNRNLQSVTKTHYSFNLAEEQELMMYIIAKPNSAEAFKFPAELMMQFSTQFDTFNKEVAKDTRVEPAMYALSNSDNYLYKLINLSDDWGQKMGLIDKEHRKMFNFITIMSCGTFLVYLFVNVYHMHAMKKFLKQKKLI